MILAETDPLGRVTEYVYETDSESNDFGRLTSVIYASGTANEATYEYEYDADGNLSTRESIHSAAAPNASTMRCAA